MRKTLMTVALMLALCPIAFAGEMGTPPVAPGQQPNSTQEQSTDSNTVATDSLIQAVLNVIVSVLP
jgi:hypothetical protein